MYKKLTDPGTQEAVEKGEQLMFIAIVKESDQTLIQFRDGKQIPVSTQDIIEMINQLSLALMMENI